jgi:hypothetical protein
VVEEVELRAAVGRWLERLCVPLEEPLGVGEAAVLLRVSGRGQEEDLRLDVLRPELTGLDLLGVAPEGGGLDQVRVPDDEPVEWDIARRWSFPLAEPTAGFSPTTKNPGTS